MPCPSMTAAQLSCCKQLILFPEKLSVHSEHLDLLCQGVRYVHGAAVVPEITVIARGGVVVKYEEITNPTKFLEGQSIEDLLLLGFHAFKRENEHELVDGRMDQGESRSTPAAP